MSRMVMRLILTTPLGIVSMLMPFGIQSDTHVSLNDAPRTVSRFPTPPFCPLLLPAVLEPWPAATAHDHLLVGTLHLQHQEDADDNAHHLGAAGDGTAGRVRTTCTDHRPSQSLRSHREKSTTQLSGSCVT